MWVVIWLVCLLDCRGAHFCWKSLVIMMLSCFTLTSENFLWVWMTLGISGHLLCPLQHFYTLAVLEVLCMYSSWLSVQWSQLKCWSVILLCRNCVQFCDEPGVNCKEGALLTQTISYTVLTLDGYDIQPYQDLMQITVFGEDGRQLQRTRYRITENETGLNDYVLF